MSRITDIPANCIVPDQTARLKRAVWSGNLQFAVSP